MRADLRFTLKLPKPRISTRSLVASAAPSASKIDLMASAQSAAESWGWWAANRTVSSERVMPAFYADVPCARSRPAAGEEVRRVRFERRPMGVPVMDTAQTEAMKQAPGLWPRVATDGKLALLICSSGWCLASAGGLCNNVTSTTRSKVIMPSPEKVPKALAEKFAAITALTDDFCAQHLNDEYRQVIRSASRSVGQEAPLAVAEGEGKRLGSRSGARDWADQFSG